MRAALLALALAVTAPVHAQVYKWVDAKGVTHYSDTPPAGKQAKAQVVEERLSIIPSDPALSAATSAMRAQALRQAELAQAEWLQRQRLMLAAQAMPGGYADCPYRMDCEWPYAYRYGYAYAPFVSRARPPHPAPHRPPRAMPLRSSRL